jgi:ketosteroid isomerase-like protein
VIAAPAALAPAACLAREERPPRAAANRRDFDLLLLSFDLEYEALVGDRSGALFPDVVGLQRGHAGYRGVWAALDEAWEGVKLEHHEIIDFGDQVVALGRVFGHARHTGIPVDQPVSQCSGFGGGSSCDSKTSRNASLSAKLLMPTLRRPDSRVS